MAGETKKAASKKAGGPRKYAPEASKSVEREMRAMKEGKLRSGNGRKVTNPKQAIAIGLSEARRGGAEMPAPPDDSASAGNGTRRKTAAKGSTRKTAAKKTPAKKTAGKKTAGKKATGRATATKSTGRKTAAKKAPARKSTGQKSTGRKTAAKRSS